MFSVWNEQLVNKRFIEQRPLSCRKIFGELSENFRKTDEISLEPQFFEYQTKMLPLKFEKITEDFW